MAEMCVNAVLAVADLDRRDVTLDLIKVMALSSLCMLAVGAGPSGGNLVHKPKLFFPATFLQEVCPVVVALEHMNGVKHMFARL